MQESWLPVKDFSNYEISSLGKLRNIKKNRLLADSIMNTGYVNNVLNKVNKLRHRLVAEAFIFNPNNRKQINHIDGNRANNIIYNLEWVTQHENMCHAWKNRRKSSSYAGVCYDKNAKTYKSYICINSKLIHLGYFKSEQDAYNARIEYQKKNNITNKYLADASLL